MRLIIRILFITTFFTAMCAACSAGKAKKTTEIEEAETQIISPQFDADSAFSFVEGLVSFGPRVPNTEAHLKAGDWLGRKLRDFGWNVIEQKAIIPAFDGTQLQARNIFAQINPGLQERILLLAHWDSRPWADEDPEPAKRSLPVLGANDGASGVGVLLEVARQLKLQNSDKGVDILFVDAEDWGSHDDEDSWAMGTRYFAANPPVEGYRPSAAILLDMVGSPDARFGYEYFSTQANPALMEKVWSKAAALGHSQYFHTGFGGAVTDDHIELIKQGIPAIDIIDYRNGNGYQGFDPVWHTTRDDMTNISRETLRAVGETVISAVSD